jgi:hypothetical protein
MKRKHTRTDSVPVLLPELMKLVAAQLDEPWFTDLRAFLRWHQCSRAHWAAYCARDQAALHYVLTQKRERQAEPCAETRHLAATLNYARLVRAVDQSTLLTAIESELQIIPKNVDRFVKDGGSDDLIGSGSFLCSESLDLNALINFCDYTNAHAVAVLEWCRQYVHARYGWHMRLQKKSALATVVVRRPWKASKSRLPGLVLAFTSTEQQDEKKGDREILNGYAKFCNSQGTAFGRMGAPDIVKSAFDGLFR